MKLGLAYGIVKIRPRFEEKDYLMSKKYKNPPIIEALCEIHFEPDASWDVDSITNILYEKVKDKFPKKFRLQLQTSQIDIGDSGTPGITEQLLPLVRFQSSDEQALIQVAPNLLTINHLKPYTSWEEFLPLIEMGVNAYREVANPKDIHRIALRYINRIEISSERISLEDYFEFRPFIGQKVLQDIRAFTMGIQILHEGARDVLSVQLTTINSEVPNTIAMLLDLTYSLARPGDIMLDDISEWVKVAHNHIEDAFEACISDQLRKLFEEVIEC